MKQAIKLVMTEGKKCKVAARRTGLDVAEIRAAVQGEYRSSNFATTLAGLSDFVFLRPFAERQESSTGNIVSGRPASEPTFPASGSERSSPTPTFTPAYRPATFRIFETKNKLRKVPTAAATTTDEYVFEMGPPTEKWRHAETEEEPGAMSPPLFVSTSAITRRRDRFSFLVFFFQQEDDSFSLAGAAAAVTKTTSECSDEVVAIASPLRVVSIRIGAVVWDRGF